MKGVIKWGVVIFVVFFLGYGVGSAGNSSTTGKQSSTTTSETKQTTTNSTDENKAENEAVASPQPVGKVEVKSHKKKVDYGMPKIVGEVINNSDKPASFVKVTATYYDKEESVVGTGFTYAGDTSSTPLQPGSTAPFEVTDINKTEYDSYKLDVTWN